ncbi:hypothetical protein V5O48_005835 [Marasmius crinis-equi]|uniref:Uncharacterized protein n=1 Tax=Marasmius crinis-equi TaxID=585013 RepID=A0ABR3FLL4_9AGAR
MVRPKLYFTRQERQQAARKASNVYYQKHKQAIRVKRQAIRNTKKKTVLSQKTVGKREMSRPSRSSKSSNTTKKTVSKTEGSSRQKASVVRDGAGDKQPESSPETLSQRWLAYATKLDKKLQASYHPHSDYKKLCQHVIKTYMSDYRDFRGDSLDKVIAVIRKYEEYVSRFEKYKNSILNSVGAGEVYDQVEEMRVNASLVASALNEIHAEAMLGFHHLSLHFNRRRFDFQKK